MNDVIGGLQSCSFDFSSSQDINDPDYGRITNYTESTVIFDGPNKMLVRSDGNKGKQGYWYNGEKITWYSFDQNNYATLDAPDNSIATIDSIYTNFDMEIPAADFFYPSYTDDILDEFPSILYLGKKTIDNIECFHIKASNATMEVHYWIANDAYNLPKRYKIIYKNENNKQYEATFDNWNLNLVVPSAIFEFMPPANASEIKIQAKN